MIIHESVFHKFDRVLINDYFFEVALIVCQSRDRNNRLSPIDLNALTKGFEKVQKVAKRTKGWYEISFI